MITINVQLSNRAVNTEDFALAVLAVASVRASSAVVVEEAVKTNSVHGNAGAVGDAETKSIAVASEASAKVRVVPGGVGLVRTSGGVGGRLVVRCFSLEVSTNDIRGTIELELVETVVLNASSPPGMLLVSCSVQRGKTYG